MSLELAGVSKRYGGNYAIEDVSFTVPSGSMYAVIGPNGAGKSTLFGTIAGEHRADSGSVILAGRDVTKDSVHKRAKAGISRAFQVARLFTSMTVEQNIRTAAFAASGMSHIFWRGAQGLESREMIATLLEQVNLDHVADRQASTLSQGDRKKLEIAMGLASRPKLLLLDEPTVGMTPEETQDVMALVSRVHEESGCSVLITEHNMRVVFGLAQRIIVLAGGRVLCEGTPEEIRENDEVRSVYLGES